MSNNRFKRYALTLLLLHPLWLWQTATAAARAGRWQTGPGASREERWRADLAFLAAELPRGHKNLFFKITREQFERSVAELEASLPLLTDAEVKIALMRIVAQIGDSHTHVRWSYDDFTVFPLRLFRFSDGWYVTEAAEEYRRVVGARLVRVGTTPAERAAATVSAMIACENDSCFKRYLPSYLVVPDILRAAKLLPQTGEGAFVFADGRGREFAVTLKSYQSGAGVRWIGPFTGKTAAELPLYRRRAEKNYWFEYLADTRTLYLNYSRCRNIEGYPFKELTREVLSVVDTRPVERLVIDMRRNAGGDEGIFRPLIAELGRRPQLNRRGKLFVIVGRGTFSSACHNAIELKNRTNAIAVGEPTGQKPNSYGEVKTLKLPNSGVEISYSTWFWKRVEGDPLSFAPDVLVDYPSAAFLSGRDPFMEAVFAAAARD